MRAALAAIHNLETLLRSPRVGTRLLRDLVPEIRVSCGALRAAFSEDVVTPADETLRDFAVTLATEVEGALSKLPARELDARARLALERLVSRAGAELDAAAELLLMARGARAVRPTDLTLADLLTEASTLPASLPTASTVAIRVDGSVATGTASADARIVGSLIAILVAEVRAKHPGGLVLRALGIETGTAMEDEARLVVEPADAKDGALPAGAVRRILPIPVMGAVAAQVAAALGARLEVDAPRAVLVLPRSAGSRP